MPTLKFRQAKPATSNQQPATSNLHPRIMFMGTPEFAVTSLDKILEAGHNIVGVITAPDKPAGRGMKLNESPVKKYAIQKSLPILQPEKLKSPEFIEMLRSLKPDLQVVVAFRMLPEKVWNMPPLGTINLHASLLPQYRGAAPINWVIINGETETGVTTFRLKHEVDTGDILLQEKIPIGENETAGELYDRIKEIGAQLLVKTINEIREGTLKPIPQEKFEFRNSNFEILRQAPKIKTETCRINWNKPVLEIHNLVRGLSPNPAAFTELNGEILKIYRSEMEINEQSLPSGEYRTDKKTFFKYACADGYLQLKEVQLAGKRKMNIEDFLRGYRP